MRTALAFLIAACVLPRTAHAGRSFYGWLYGTEVMPVRGVELQTWVQEENDKYSARLKESWVAWGAQVGITDQLELGLPVELIWSDAPSPTDPTARRTLFTFKRFGIEARYRLAPADPVEAGPLVPLIRIAIKRDVIQRDTARLEGDAVVSYASGRIHALVDVGVIGDVSSDAQHVELHPGAGISIQATSELRVGAEIYSELSLDEGESWATAGPNISWSHGRFWASGAFGIGLYHVRIAPRVIWGIAF